ncbi:MAG: FkbM family methyltransferase [Desulfobacteraceae bacterium]|jgi:FkbM family methyltransferase
MVFYFQSRTRIADLYYHFWQKYGREASFFPFISKEKDHYLAHYVLPREWHRHLQPFQFLKEGDHVIQVGFHDQYIYNGISHPLIISGIIGESGHVLSIDPDKTNTEAMNRYKDICQINNISVLETGVWNEKATLEFLLFDDYTSSNTIADVFSGFRDGAERRWGKKRLEEKSTVRSIEVETLDSILENKISISRVDFVNITVNGAEPYVLEGAKKTLETNDDIKIAFPLANVSPATLDDLNAMGFLIALADAPHRPWEKKQFLFACAVREDPDFLFSHGFHQVSVRAISTLSDDGVGGFVIEDPNGS